MVIVDVREILCVAVTTVFSLVPTTIPRMTVVRDPSQVPAMVDSPLEELDSSQTVSLFSSHKNDFLQSGRALKVFVCCRLTTARAGDNNDDNIDV